jgi:hypothetical protein
MMIKFMTGISEHPLYTQSVCDMLDISKSGLTRLTKAMRNCGLEVIGTKVGNYYCYSTSMSLEEATAKINARQSMKVLEKSGQKRYVEKLKRANKPWFVIHKNWYEAK